MLMPLGEPSTSDGLNAEVFNPVQLNACVEPVLRRLAKASRV